MNTIKKNNVLRPETEKLLSLLQAEPRLLSWRMHQVFTIRLFCTVLPLLWMIMLSNVAEATTVANVCAAFGNVCAAGEANINVRTTVTCDSVLDFVAAGFPTVNVNAGGSLEVVNEPLCGMTLNVGDLLVRTGGQLNVDKSRTKNPGRVTVQANGTITVENGGKVTAIGGRGEPNATIEFVAQGEILIAGLLEARGKTALAHGGHILLESVFGQVTITGTAQALASSTDPGGTLIVIKACLGIDIFGVVDATAKKRGAEIQLFSRETIRILGGQVVADLTVGELGITTPPFQATHKITMEARDDIVLENALVSANAGGTNKQGGTIEVLSTEGGLSCDPRTLIQAEATAGGSNGGVLSLRAFENLLYDCFLRARGNKSSGQGGTVLLQSFQNDVLGSGDVQAVGKVPGAIVLKAATPTITDGGTFDPLPTLLANTPEAAPKVIAPCVPPPLTPDIALEKLVNGNPADTCPGVSVAPNSQLDYEYQVTNTGNTVLINVVVTDNLLGTIGTIPRLDPGQTTSLFATATMPATGQRENIGTVVGTPATATGTPTGQPDVTDTDPACATVSIPAIDLEKFVNGDDADVCPGVTVNAGSTLNYEYRVTNTGNTVLINVQVTDDLLGTIGTIPRLDPGQATSLFAQATAPATGQRRNLGTVVGTPATAAGTPTGQPNVTDTDPACATAPGQPDIDLKKSVNGDPADVCPGLSVAPGSSLTYEYKVTNPGNTVLINVVVTDNLLGTIGTIPRLDPGQMTSLFAFATAPATGQRENIGMVVGTPATAAGAPTGQPNVTDQDRACVTVPSPAIDLEKFVNGDPADVCPGVNVLPGSTLSYEYKITNTGDTVLINVVVTDNLLGTIGTIPRLDPGQMTSLFATATAPATGSRENIGTVVGTPATATGTPLGLPNVTDTDPACATVPGPAIDLKKSVNGDPADVCPGITVAPNAALNYEYKVTNIGDTVLVNVQVTDDLLGPIGAIPRLDPGQMASLFAQATAPAAGQRKNTGMVVGTPANAAGVPLGLPNVTDDDPACATVSPGVCLVIIDEDGIDNDISTIEQAAFSHGVTPDFLVNDDSPTEVGNPPLRWNTQFPGDVVLLPTGQVDDEGWFTLPENTPWPLGDFVAGVVPQSQLDKIPNVMPLRNQDLVRLVGRTCVAVVYDSDISMNYVPINANLQGARYGLFTFTVFAVEVPGSIPESQSSTSLYNLWVRVESPMTPTERFDVVVHDHEPDSIQINTATYSGGILTVQGSSSFPGGGPGPGAPEDSQAFMTVSIDGSDAGTNPNVAPFILEAPMTFAGGSAFVFTLNTPVNLDGRRVTISTDEGGAYNDFIK